MNTTIDEINMKRVRETLFYTKLENGLEIFVLPKKGYSKQFAIFATNFGSIDSEFSAPGETLITKVPDGVAHFLEHKLFEEEEGNVFGKFSRLGASANAYTNFTNTAYLFTSTSNFYRCLDVLIGFVQNPYFTEQNVEKEKGIISQEIRMYDDNGEWRSFFNLMQGLYHRHPVRIDIAGTVESISRIDKDVLYRCYNNFYHPDNMMVFVAGDVDVGKTIKVVRENMPERVVKRTGSIRRFYNHEPKTIYNKRVEQSLAVSQPIFNLGFKDEDVGYGGKMLFIKDIASSILLEIIFGKGSDLYERLYGEGLINDTFSFDFSADIDYSYSILGGESPDPDRVAEIIEETVAAMKPEHLTQEGFMMARNKLMGRYLKRFNSLEYVATNFVSYHFKGANFLEFIDCLEGIELQFIRDRFRTHIKPESMVLSVVLPNQGKGGIS